MQQSKKRFHWQHKGLEWVLRNLKTLDPVQDEMCIQETESGEDKGFISGKVFGNMFLKCSSNCSWSLLDAAVAPGTCWKAGSVLLQCVRLSAILKNTFVHTVFAVEPEWPSSCRPAWRLIQTLPGFCSTDSLSLPVVSSQHEALLVRCHSSYYWHTPTIFTNIVILTVLDVTFFLISVHCVTDWHHL